MRFVLVDRILEINTGRSLVAVKNLSLAEEYLGDHFPGFPVMPGVLMLEALTQAGAWLIRETDDYSHSMIVLKAARGIKYGNFVAPGNQLKMTVELTAHGADESTFKGVGEVDGQEMVKGRITLRRYNLADTDPTLAATDEAIVASLRDRFASLMMQSLGTRAFAASRPVGASPIA
jgi:3-hydroxyacyl-[acyl-carrier-protein] dehydratase